MSAFLLLLQVVATLLASLQGNSAVSIAVQQQVIAAATQVISEVQQQLATESIKTEAPVTSQATTSGPTTTTPPTQMPTQTSTPAPTSASTPPVTNTANAPSISGISPASGSAGTQVTVTGSGFVPTAGFMCTPGVACDDGGNTVQFGSGVTITNLNTEDGVTVQFEVPQDITPGVYNVSIVNNKGTSNTVSFTVE